MDGAKVDPWFRAEPRDAFRTGKAYTAPQAARLVGTSPQMVRRWLGIVEGGAPVFGDNEGAESQMSVVSFLELIEIAVVAQFRRGTPSSRPITLERLRRAHRFAREQFDLPYPFATLRLREAGGHVMHEFDEAEHEAGVLALDQNGQWVLPGPVQQARLRADYFRAYAARWYALGHSVPIVIDPAVAGGRPTIVKTGVPVQVIRQRFEAGAGVKDLIDDFEITHTDVEAALRFAA